jgi:opine dehydrogenase
VTQTGDARFIPDFGYRYLTEDVPFGLVATRALAELAEVHTPTIDDVILWSQAAMQKVYLVDGRMRGRDLKDLPIPQNHGVATLSDLTMWYRSGSLLAA